MNTRGHDLVVVLRGIFGMLPGATALTVYAFRAWTYILIAVSTDTAVRALGRDLGLETPEYFFRPTAVQFGLNQITSKLGRVS